MSAGSRRVLKWIVPADDHDHPIGGGSVLHVAIQTTNPDIPSGRVTVWTDEDLATPLPIRSARVFGTGQPVPNDDQHIGSCLDGPLVWHLFASARPATLREAPRG